MVDCDRIARLDGEKRGSQREGGPFARGPGFEQPRIGDARCAIFIQHDGNVGLRQPARSSCQTAAFDDGLPVVRGARDVAKFGCRREVGFLTSRECEQRLGRLCLDEVIGSEHDRSGIGAALAEADEAVAFNGIDEISELERLYRLACRHRPVDDEPCSRAGDCRRVVASEAVIVEDGSDHGAGPGTGEPAVEPVTKAPVRTIAPHGSVGRKSRVRARVPGIDVDTAGIDHALAGERRHGILASVAGIGGVERFSDRLQVAPLDEVVARAP